MFCDSQSAIHLTKDQTYLFKYHLICDIILEGKVAVSKISTLVNSANPDDMLTKSLSTVKFKSCLDLIGICKL